MDPYYEERGRGWQPPDDWDGRLGDQMLLVLLDEMNLACVEYYFSDLLRELETRREIGPQVPPSDRTARSRSRWALIHLVPRDGGRMRFPQARSARGIGGEAGG